MNAISLRCACPSLGSNGASRLFSSQATSALERLPHKILTLRQPSVADPHGRPRCPQLSNESNSRQIRLASSSSSTRWKSRQTNDAYAREAKVAGLKSRAAFKLLEIHAKYRLFKRGDTVVDLGFAPGSWSQVAVSKTQPGGRVVGIDVIPAQPPRGANALQGNFLSPEIRERMREFVGDRNRGRVGKSNGVLQQQIDEEGKVENIAADDTTKGHSVDTQVHDEGQAAERQDQLEGDSQGEEPMRETKPHEAEDVALGRVVDVVLSDMSAPWPLINSTWVKSVNTPYLRMMNTSGINFRDHAGSMDLCTAALDFCYSSLATDGHFLTKFYMGAEDQLFEKRLRRLFHKVHRIKPDSSRKESKEAYFLGLRRKKDVPIEDVFGDL